MSKEYKPQFLPENPPELPFTNVNGNWVLNRPIMTPDFVSGKSGFQLDPTGGFSKINAFGGNVTLYDAVVDASGKGQFKTIQDALNAGKKRIFVRAGTYVISSSITITSDDIFITGESRTETVLQFSSSVSSDIPMIDIGDNVTSYENFLVKNLTLDGNRSNQSTATNGIRVRLSSILSLEDCILKNFEGNAVYLMGGANYWYIQNNVFEDNDYNVYVEASTTAITSNGWIFGNFMNVTSSGKTTCSILTTGSSYIFILNNNIIYNSYAIEVLGHNNFASWLIKIANNHFSPLFSATEDLDSNIAILLSKNSKTFAPKWVVIAVNTFTDSNRSNAVYGGGTGAIKFSGVENCSIGNNLIEGMAIKANDTDAVILLTDTSKYNVIVGNNINTASDAVRYPKYGIREGSSNDDYNLIVGNIVQSGVTANISTQGVNTVSANNIS
jgi:hypothetical protein